MGDLEPGRQFDPELVALPEQGRIPWSIHYQPTVTSTQDLARGAALGGAAEGWTLVTDWQEAGRGRVGRAWVAPAGYDLLFSTVLRPPAPLMSLLPLLAALAVAEGLFIATGLRADLKWPNDLLVEQRKLAGILLERGGSNDVVLGVGMNVNSQQAELPAGATSVAVSRGRAVAREHLLTAILDQLDRALVRARTEGPAWIVPGFAERSSMLGRPITYLERNQRCLAVAEAIGADGSLTVRREDGTQHHLYAGEVHLVPAQS